MSEATTPARAQQPTGRRRRRGALIAVVVIIAAALVGTTWWSVRSYGVPSESMAPTLNPGDHVLVDRLTYRLTGLRRGDLVIYRRPQFGIEALGRVVGLPGDHLSCQNDRLYLGSAPAEEPYLPAGTLTEHCTRLTVPPDTLYLLGDHRSVSADSRYFGPVHRDQVVGRVLTRYRTG